MKTNRWLRFWWRWRSSPCEDCGRRTCRLYEHVIGISFSSYYCRKCIEVHEAGRQALLGYHD